MVLLYHLLFLSRLKAWWILINIMSMLSQYILYQEFFFFHVCVLNFPDFSKKRRRNWLTAESSVTYQSCQKPGAVPLNTTCTAYSPCTTYIIYCLHNHVLPINSLLVNEMWLSRAANKSRTCFRRTVVSCGVHWFSL